ncbi:MAG: hypothetical protein GY849_24780 [Deltaproteobacteria bacterium]|nr:hypothetical protein [Deltaproteobacteria bacterium]
MTNREYYEEKLPVLKAMPVNEVKKLNHIPVGVYIQEASDLSHWCRDDREALTANGLDWAWVEDLQPRFGALIHAEAEWYNCRTSREEEEKIWAQKAAEGGRLRKELLHRFRFAFTGHPRLLMTVNAVGKGERYSKIIQALNDLSTLGNAHRDLLEKINFDMSLLDKAAEAAEVLPECFGAAKCVSRKRDGVKGIRDRAYTHLKEAVDHIRRYGQYVFKGNPQRSRGYASQYLKKKRARRKSKPSAKE